MFLSNDPWVGAAHQMDVTLLNPVFWEGKLFCWITNVLHQYDVGGITPGSFCPNARDAFDEGILIPPIKIVERGELRRDIEGVYLRASRKPYLVALDLRAQIAGNVTAARRIIQLIQRYGPDVVKGVMRKIIDNAEAAFLAKMAKLPDGTWRERSYVEVARVGDRGTYPVMSVLTLGVDHWGLAWPRFVQGLGIGFIFVPLNAVALATIPREAMGNATALLNVVRNLGGGIGVALVSTILARRSQHHQSTLVAHVNPFDPETAERLSRWAHHFEAQGTDSFTAQRQALATVYHEVTRQAQVLSFADDFGVLFLLFCSTLLLLPLLQRVHAGPVSSSRRHHDDAPAPVAME